MSRALLALALLATAASAQERLWEVYSGRDAYTYVTTFGDFDRDGRDDALTICWVNFGFPGQYQSVRILSGTDGSVLHEHALPLGTILSLSGVGDFDRDGYPDYLLSIGGFGVPNPGVWSPHLQRYLMQFQFPPVGGGFYVFMGGGDVDGDSLPDIVIGSGSAPVAAIYAYDHYGNPLHSTPIAQWGIAREGAFVGDQDGDGCEDYAIGIDWWNNFRGLVILVSGRTGTILRMTEGEQPGDRLCGPIAPIGDLDRDGRTDYAVGNYWGGGDRINVYSGATGTILRQWISTTHDIGARFLCGPDVDLDGIPDVISGSGNFVNSTPFRGRVQAFSSLDQQVLAFVEPYANNYRPEFAAAMASLGVQPGSPYPVIAFTEAPILQVSTAFRRIQTWRLSPPGTRVLGTGCSTRGQPPTIGIRRVTATTGETCRITLGSSLPSALAWCLIGPASPIPPLPLSPFGFPGCDLLVAPMWIASRATAAAGIPAGYAGIDVPLQLAGTQITTATPYSAQWLLLDPLTLDYAATPRHEFAVQ